MASLDEELERAEELRSANQKQKRLGMNQTAATQAGQRAASSIGKAAALSAGSEAAVGGAIAGALQGGSVTDIAKSAWSAYIVWFALGFLTLDVILSPALVPILFALIALAYLDFHYVMSKVSSIKIFGPMNPVQRAWLFAANGLVILILAIIPATIFGAEALICDPAGTFETALYAGPIYGINLGPLASIAKNKVCGPPPQVSTNNAVVPPTTTTANLDIVVTSAYRPGSVTINKKPSAHGRGEAVDIALRNPSVPIHGSDPRIAQLITIAKNAGFVPTIGDTLDEYAQPNCDVGDRSCGGHVHVEFNTYANGTKTYCDNTTVTGSPNDLVSLASAGIPYEGIVAPNRPQIRPCMMARLQNIFLEAGIITP